LTPLRVGLVGARAARQGLGPYVARDLVASGLEVPCFLGTSDATVRQAGEKLRERTGVEARGYTCFDRMLARESLDAVAILSPAHTHERFLLEAAAAGLHVLCEKPLLWGGEELALRARRCVEAFHSARLLLAENCQWPFTLEAFRRLHPGTGEGVPRRFEMWLSPTSRGLQQLGDCLPHALSLLQALVPGEHPCIEKPTIKSVENTPETTVSFEYVSGSARVEVSVELRAGGPQPRAAGFAIDGARGERVIQMAEYTMELSDGTRSVDLPDPLTARIASFAGELRSACTEGSVPSPASLSTRMTMLEALVAAWPMVDERPDLSE
jgi:predicted dehydrogenase